MSTFQFSILLKFTLFEIVTFHTTTKVNKYTLNQYQIQITKLKPWFNRSQHKLDSVTFAAFYLFNGTKINRAL